VSGIAQVLEASGGWLALVALVAAVIALLWLSALQRRVRMVTPDVRRLVRDMDGKSVEEVLRDLLGNMELLGSRLSRVQVAADDLQRRLDGTLQHKGLVRYNADRSIGGELSFALALLDGSGDGVLITSLHTLEECRLYVRSIERGACEHDLSEEETEALQVALGQRRPEPEAGSRMRRTRWRERSLPSGGSGKKEAQDAE
jgi:hypothetical protein